MDTEEKERLKLEYTEDSHNVRQIDTRIWVIYGIYLAIVAGAFAYVFNPQDEGQEQVNILVLILISITMILASLAVMAIVGHLQSYSDIFYKRLREIEEKLDLDSHKRFSITLPITR